MARRRPMGLFSATDPRVSLDVLAGKARQIVMPKGWRQTADAIAALNVPDTSLPFPFARRKRSNAL